MIQEEQRRTRRENITRLIQCAAPVSVFNGTSLTNEFVEANTAFQNFLKLIKASAKAEAVASGNSWGIV